MAAPTIAAAITAHAGVSLGAADLANLVAYVEQIGSQELAAPIPNRMPVLSSPGSQSGYTSVAVNLALVATDADGDVLTYSAMGLPAGLIIGASTGRITGTPTTAGSSIVTVTASDGRASASQMITWTLTTRDTTAPSQPASFTVATSSGRPSLTWGGATDNVGVAAYVIYRSSNGTQGGEVARTTAAARNWVDVGFQEKVRYTYSVRAVDAAGNPGALTPLRSVTVSQAPTTPTIAIALASGDPRPSWTAASDNVGVAGYIVYRSTSNSGGSEVARTSSLAWVDASARSGRRYYYNVRAYDAAGNLSARSGIVSVVAK
jgi:mannan endo-1,4-beta-mannosidase